MKVFKVGNEIFYAKKIHDVKWYGTEGFLYITYEDTSEMKREIRVKYPKGFLSRWKRNRDFEKVFALIGVKL